jgi:hypothetical protein
MDVGYEKLFFFCFRKVHNHFITGRPSSSLSSGTTVAGTSSSSSSNWTAEARSSPPVETADAGLLSSSQETAFFAPRHLTNLGIVSCKSYCHFCSLTGGWLRKQLGHIVARNALGPYIINRLNICILWKLLLLVVWQLLTLIAKLISRLFM